MDTLYPVAPAKITTRWWLITVAGILLIGLGIFCLLSALNAYILFIRYAGIALLLNGIMLFAVAWYAPSTLKEKKWLLAEAVLDFIFAMFLLFNPFMSFITFPLLIGPWMIGKGIIKGAAAFTVKIPGVPYVFIAGTLSVVFGLLIMYHPLDREDAITIFLGLFGIVMGTLYIFDSIRFRNHSATLDLLI